jgi:beta-N-acetylhexosaminidase
VTIASLAQSVVALGFDGARVADAPLAEIAAFAPGAVVLFARNVGPPDELRELVGALRAGAPVPPLIAVDQEGGRVARIAAGVAPVPAAMAIGAAGDVDGCEQVGTLLGRDLARLGISVDFAPVADCASEQANTAIGTRAFGGDPVAVGRFAAAFARGLERGGVAATLKHFPGHGATAVDSHLALPHVTAHEATLRERDLVPFAAAISGGAASIVMSAHVVVEAFDETAPATLSRRILTGLLRDELGFDGVAVTDCLQMDAIAGTLGTPAGGVAALAAGADLLLVSHSLAVARDVANAVVAAVEDGSIPLARLEQAAARVSALRERYAVLAPFAGPLDADLPLRIARDAVTVVRGDIGLRRDRAVTVISFEGTSFDGAAGQRANAPSLSSALRARRWKSEIMRVPLEPQADDVDVLLSHVPALGDRNFVIATRRAHLIPRQAATVARILAIVPDAIVISCREPYDVFAWPEARNVACIYGDDALAFEGCADVLSGTAEPRGRLPLPIGDVAPR